MARMCQPCKLSLDGDNMFCPNCGKATRKFRSTGTGFFLLIGLLVGIPVVIFIIAFILELFGIVLTA